MTTVPKASGAFGAFLEREGVDKEWYDKQASAAVPRFVRVRSEIDPSELGTSTTALPWLKDFLALPGESKLKGNRLYEQGLIQGIDAASGFVVNTLEPLPGQRVLDLCCAPGAKFCMLADVMQRRGALIGVDAALSRANTCASLCKKYRVAKPKEDWECMLVHDDGTTFSCPWESKAIVWCSDADRRLFGEEQVEGQLLDDESKKKQRKNDLERRRLTKSARRYLEKTREGKKRKVLEERAENSAGVELFDRVLVDAECTHDGSVRHMAKYAQGGVFGEDLLEEKFLNADNCKHSSVNSLESLQRGLISNGFKLLKPGGILVYSTCSFCKSQNESIVKWLLETVPDAELVNIPQQVREMQEIEPPFVESKVLAGTVSFEPIASGTSGLFVAKLRKKE